MQISPEQQSEYNKLVHLLGEQDSTVLSFLARLSPDELTTLRQKVQSAIYSEQSSQWKRVAGVAKFMPNFVNAKVAEQVLGPVITANISYYIDVRDAVSIMRFLSLSFMAEVAGYMVPEKSKALINQLPMDLMKKLVVYLCQHNKHFVVGSFVEVTELNRVVEIALHLSKESDLVGITQYVRDKSSLAGVYRAFSETKRYKLIEEAWRARHLDIVIEMAMYLQWNEVVQMSKLIQDRNPTLFGAITNEIMSRNSDGRYNQLVKGFER